MLMLVRTKGVNSIRWAESPSRTDRVIRLRYGVMGESFAGTIGAEGAKIGLTDLIIVGRGTVTGGGAILTVTQ